MGESGNHRLINALLKQPVDRTPIWIMRQAGRYLPEYRRVREQARDFLTLCKTPELVCEVTLQPLERFDFDAAIIFSDILVIPEAMGLELEFIEGQGPRFRNPIRDEKALTALRQPVPEEDLGYVLDAIRLVRSELDGKVPLIGFVGSPWTLAVYMIEGASGSDFSQILKMMRERPRLLGSLLEKLSAAVAAHLNAQIEAGAQCVMIFDTWGGVLSDSKYPAFSLEPTKRAIERLYRTHENKIIPRVLFTRSKGRWFEEMADSGCDALGIDQESNIGEARRRVGDKVALQGNLDPAVLCESPQRIREEARRIIHDFGPGPGHVFNLGHGITPDVPVENVMALIEAVHRFGGPDSIGPAPV